MMTKSTAHRTIHLIPRLGIWMSLLVGLCTGGLLNSTARSSGRPHAIADSGNTGAARLKESVRAELVRLQEQTGLTLASDDARIEVVRFDKRWLLRGNLLFNAWSSGVVSRDGTEIAASYKGPDRGLSLGIIRSDGTDLRAFTTIRPQRTCLSNDKSKVAITVPKHPQDAELEVMDLASTSIEEVGPKAELTSQCWSPDDKEIVYESDGSIMVYEIGKDKSTSRVLGKGTYPTWSPDGQWIAFLDRDTYYAIHPDGQSLKKLFHKSASYSGLLWSPDTRIVAYVSEAGLFEGGWRYLDAEMYRLRVRRLEDNSEDWVAEGQLGESFQWVTSPELLKQLQQSPAPK